jgi:histidinol-phosphate aminotransferase
MIPPATRIAAMSPYALAQLDVPEGKRLISLSQNESLRRPSPSIAEAAAKAMAEGHLYPDPDWSDLRATLAETYSVPAEAILCGSGSIELIASLMQAFADPQNAVLAPCYTYPFFRTAAQLARARYDTASEGSDGVSVDALLDAVRPDTRVVCVANPGNPTGTRVSRTELVRLRDGLPENVLLVIDEAYGEFADHLGEPIFDLAKRGNTVILRSFSKAYGLAGMRVGWGVFPPDIATEVRKVLRPNNIPAVAQAAAVAAVLDQPYMQETCRLTASLRDRFRMRLNGAGFGVHESFTNFVLIRFPSAQNASDADAFLRSEGVFLRPQNGVGLSDCLRATIGGADDLNAAADLLERWVERSIA